MKVQNYCIKKGIRVNYNELSFSGVYMLGIEHMEDNFLHAEIQSAIERSVSHKKNWTKYFDKNVWNDLCEEDVFLLSGYSSNIKDELSGLLLAVIDIIQLFPIEHREKIVNSNFYIYALAIDEIQKSETIDMFFNCERPAQQI